MDTKDADKIVSSLRTLMAEIDKNNEEKGWNDDFNLQSALLLVIGEVSESVEWLRKGDNAKSDHIPEYDGFSEEMADVIILVLHICAHERIDIGNVIIAKMIFNKSRPYKHGKRF